MICGTYLPLWHRAKEWGWWRFFVRSVVHVVYFCYRSYLTEINTWKRLGKLVVRCVQDAAIFIDNEYCAGYTLVCIFTLRTQNCKVPVLKPRYCRITPNSRKTLVHVERLSKAYVLCSISCTEFCDLDIPPLALWATVACLRTLRSLHQISQNSSLAIHGDLLHWALCSSGMLCCIISS